LTFKKLKQMKHWLPLIFLVLIATCTLAQQPTRSEVERSGRYYYGAGIATDENRARDEALSAISSMIAVTVAGSFETMASETDLKYTEAATSIIKTYSTATLRNVESMRNVLGDGKVEVFCYISKEKVNDLYEQRKQLVLNLLQEGEKCEQANNLAFALKNWYFGIILLKSVPEEKVIVNNVNLTVELPAAINRVIHNIRFELDADKILDENFREISLKASYNGRPVSLLHFRFWDGRDNNGTGQVRDGYTTIRLAGANTAFDRITIYPQTEYYTARTENRIVEELWELVKHPDFTYGIAVGLKKISIPEPMKESLNNSDLQPLLKFDESVAVAEIILRNTSNFIENLSSGNPEKIRSSYAADPFLAEKVRDYMIHNNPQFIKTDEKADVNPTRNGYEVRKLRVLQQYPTINRQSTEYIVLDFDQEGTLVDMNLCITDELYDKFVKQSEFGQDWQQRQEIIKFVEKYRTAFHTRDLETIDKMFAEEALILIGRKIETRKVKSNELVYYPLPGQPDFEQIQLTKKEYIERQKLVFDYQKDIFIDFSNFDIAAKSNANNVYGVQMRQSYASTTYADEGYLFLLIDFHEQDPLIYVRAWQPNEWDSSALVNSANFRVFK